MQISNTFWLTSLAGTIITAHALAMTSNRGEASVANRPHGDKVDITILSESLKPLQDHFNANKDKHRLIAILSPT